MSGLALPIYVDVDDVLADTTATLLVLARELFAKEVAYEECHSFDLGESFGLSDHERDRLLEAAHDDRVIESMRPIDGAADTLARWEALGHEVEIVTGRPPGTLRATGRWLRRHRMPHATLSSVDKYQRHAAAAEAVPLERLAARRFHVAIEDSASMAAFLVRETATPVLLLDRPWNRDVTALASSVRRHIRRVTSWAEIADLLSRRWSVDG